MTALCIHQVCFGFEPDFATCVAALQRQGVGLTAVWHDKLAAVGARAAARLLSDHGVEAVALCPGGVLTARHSGPWQAALAHNRRLLDDAAAIGARSLVVISGGLEEGERDLRFARDRALEGISRLLPDARAAGVRLAIEPLHPMTCAFRGVLTTLAQANDWCDLLDAGDSVGIALDSYATWWDPALPAEIARAGPRLLHLHIADWLPDTGDVRLDRGMPGDGVIDFESLLARVASTGFSGPLEFEIFSARNWWRQPPNRIAAACAARAARLGDVLALT
ncbi:MAG: sugar phosphate isomerase/epimerase [Spirochaetaceae bacterium]|nr:sugar phosphate isomerase/epimerase [Spirochaetaceae bacterium]MDE0448226.1 sugar phosphate isomerase/epimerase [Spirochaetaceae bacterium]